MGLKETVGHYMKQNLIAVDQVVNTLIGGWADETLSSVAHRQRMKGHRYWGWTAKAINMLFFWQNDHCRGAYNEEMQRRHLPVHMRAKV